MNTKIILCVMSFIFVFSVFSHNQHYHSNPYLYEIVESVKPIFYQHKTFYGSLEIMNERDVFEEITIKPSSNSYTVNKKVVYLCLVDKTTQKRYDKNTVIYVLIHELAHVLCDEIGHTDKYREIFDDLILEATTLGIYDPSKKFDPTYPSVN